MEPKLIPVSTAGIGPPLDIGWLRSGCYRCCPRRTSFRRIRYPARLLTHVFLWRCRLANGNVVVAHARNGGGLMRIRSTTPHCQIRCTLSVDLRTRANRLAESNGGGAPMATIQ